MVGAIAGTSTVTGTLIAGGALVGAANGVCAATGILTGNGALVGVSIGVSTATGSLSTGVTGHAKRPRKARRPVDDDEDVLVLFCLNSRQFNG
jgi:hypothetical protein